MSVAVVLLAVGSVARANLTGAGSQGMNFTTLALGDVTGVPTATPAGGCATATIAWTAATNANSYRVQSKTANGAWTNINAETGNVTSIVDSSGLAAYQNRSVTWRVYSRRNATGWESVTPPSTATINCGTAPWVGEVSSVTVTNPCNTNLITWSAAASSGGTNYDVWRSINGAAFVLQATDQAGTTYTDATATVGQSAAYYVVPGTGATNGNISNTATILSFSKFIVSAVTFTNSGAANSVNAGDKATVTFNKAAAPTTPSGTNSTSVYVRAGTAGTRGVYLSSAAAATGSTAIGQAVFSANIVGTSQAFTGTTAWSAGNTVWTWTSTNATVAEAAPAWAGTWNLGTSAANPAFVTCSDSASALSASAITPTGWF